MKKPLIFGTLSMFLLMLVFGVAYASEGKVSSGPEKLQNKLLTGSEELPTDAQVSSNLGASRSPGTQVGDTRYDYQHNGSMGRQIVVTYEGTTNYGGVHIDWMNLPCEGVTPSFRHIRYNARDFTGNWAWNTGPGAGKDVTQENGGYCSIDVSHDGNAVLGYHNAVDPDQYTAKVSMDHNPPVGWFDPFGEAPGPQQYQPLNNCQGWVTGSYEPTSSYIWPKVEYDECGEDTVFHLVASESPEEGSPAGEIQTVVYWKGTWNPMGAGSPEFPECATAIDSVYDITVIVRQDPNSDEVAIVWGHPIHYDGDVLDPCGNTQYQNDVYIWKSYDCGDSFLPEDKMNVTDYTVGGTVPIDQVNQLLYTDLSALYDHNGVLHVVWSTPLRDVAGGEGCDPLYASRIWHWDDTEGGCITIVYDASRPAEMHDPGAWNSAACKVNVSECDERLYCSFTRFGFHTSTNGDTSADASAGNYENGDIGLVGSSDGGKTWSEAVNLTNTNTDGCAAGDCESEHWSTMAKYSNDSVYIQYIEDKDAGGYPQTEGTLTCNPVRMMTHPCFEVQPYCNVGYVPTRIDYPMHIAPDDGSGDCTSGITTNFTLTLDNIGNQATNYTITSSETWLTPGTSGGTLNAGCGASVDIQYTIGPIATEGVYDATLTISACDAGFTAVINVRVFVYCYFYVPERELLSTACWSIGVWNNARAGTAQWDDPEGNMYWGVQEVSFMYDESVIITYADDTCQTWFSMFDGSDDDVDLRALSYLTTAVFPTYEYAHALWCNGDTNVTGDIEYYLPIHPDTCVLIERVKVCNNTDTPMTIHIGEGIDWDIPDGGDGSNNSCGYDEDRQMLWQAGPNDPAEDPIPEDNYYGGASFCNDIPGGEVSMNDSTVYNNGGYDPCWIGGLLARASSFELAPEDSIEDLNTAYAVAQNLTLDPDSCYVFCKVKAGSMEGLAVLQALIDKGKQWIEDHELDCPGCPPQQGPCDAEIGNANGSTEEPTIDIDDVVYLIAYIFSGGPAPVPYASASGDANCSCVEPAVDIDDVVYLIAYIFSGGPAPCTCEEWVVICGELH